MRSSGVCVNCGYDLTGLPEPNCPECSQRKQPEDEHRAAMQKHAVRGSIWTLGGYGASQVLRMANSLIVSRLVIPDIFGVMTIVNTFLQGLQMFSDVGIRPSIIQSKRGNDPVFLNTAWTISAIRGTLLWLVACAAAWPLSLFFSNVPQLAVILPVSGLTALVSGFMSTSMATANRQFAFGRLTILDLVLQILSTGSVILYAKYYSPTPWAFVIGSLVNAVGGLIASHFILPGIKHRFMIDRDCARELMRFGRWIFLSTAITFLSVQSDRIVLGKLAPIAVVGLYNIASMWSRLPAEVFQKLAMGVFFPIMSSAINSATFNPETIRKMRGSMLLPVAIGCGAVVAIAKPTIELMYLPTYAEAGPLLAILAISTWIGTIQYTYGAVLLAAGKPKYITFGTAGKTILFLAAAFPLYFNWGARGIAAAVCVSEVAALIPVAIGAGTLKVASPGREVVLTFVGTAFGTAMYGVYIGLRAAIADPSVGKAVGVGAVGVITGAVCLTCLLMLVKGMKKR